MHAPIHPTKGFTLFITNGYNLDSCRDDTARRVSTGGTNIAGGAPSAATHPFPTQAATPFGAAREQRAAADHRFGIP